MSIAVILDEAPDATTFDSLPHEVYVSIVEHLCIHAHLPTALSCKALCKAVKEVRGRGERGSEARAGKCSICLANMRQASIQEAAGSMQCHMNDKNILLAGVKRLKQHWEQWMAVLRANERSTSSSGVPQPAAWERNVDDALMALHLGTVATVNPERGLRVAAEWAAALAPGPTSGGTWLGPSSNLRQYHLHG